MEAYCILKVLSVRYYSNFRYNFHFNLCVQFLGAWRRPWETTECEMPNRNAAFVFCLMYFSIVAPC